MPKKWQKVFPEEALNSRISHLGERPADGKHGAENAALTGASIPNIPWVLRGVPGAQNTKPHVVPQGHRDVFGLVLHNQRQ